MITLRFRNVTLLVGTETPVQLFEDLLSKPDPPELKGRGHHRTYGPAISPDILKQRYIWGWMQWRELERDPTI